MPVSDPSERWMELNRPVYTWMRAVVSEMEDTELCHSCNDWLLTIRDDGLMRLVQTSRAWKMMLSCVMPEMDLSRVGSSQIRWLQNNWTLVQWTYDNRQRGPVARAWEVISAGDPLDPRPGASMRFLMRRDEEIAAWSDPAVGAPLADWEIELLHGEVPPQRDVPQSALDELRVRLTGTSPDEVLAREGHTPVRLNPAPVTSGTRYAPARQDTGVRSPNGEYLLRIGDECFTYDVYTVQGGRLEGMRIVRGRNNNGRGFATIQEDGTMGLWSRFRDQSDERWVIAAMMMFEANASRDIPIRRPISLDLPTTVTSRYGVPPDIQVQMTFDSRCNRCNANCFVNRSLLCENCATPATVRRARTMPSRVVAEPDPPAGDRRVMSQVLPDQLQ